MQFDLDENEIRQDIKSLPFPALQQELARMGEPGFRAKQIFKWLHKEMALSFSQMTDLPVCLRQELSRRFIIPAIQTQTILRSKIDQTVKFLFRLHDKETIECVIMQYSYGSTVCISTQAGCAMGCAFCASAKHGKKRNLAASEMLLQIEQAQKETGQKISRVVLMGIGEPFDNYQNVMDFLSIIHDPNGRQLSHRHITISTCGIVPKIIETADRNLQITLSVSLHACTDEKRSALMPVNRTYPIESLLKACRYYYKKTGRRVSFEYALINGVNDDAKEAQALSGLLKAMGCHVNLIPVNPVDETSFAPPAQKRLYAFQAILQQNGIVTTIRRSLGRDIDAACGQLRQTESAVPLIQ